MAVWLVYLEGGKEENRLFGDILLMKMHLDPGSWLGCGSSSPLMTCDSSYFYTSTGISSGWASQSP
jgi:hypothetical protein